MKPVVSWALIYSSSPVSSEEDRKITAPPTSGSAIDAIDGPQDPQLPLARLKSPSWTRRELMIFVLIIIVGLTIRVVRLSQPNEVVFDETYYAKDACLYLGLGSGACLLQQETEQSYVHPPLGKWLIAIGIKAAGFNALGWRISAAFFGTALTGVVYLLARKLFRDRWIAAIAGLLSTTDFLLIVQSRIAMLDIFLAFFVTLGFLFLSLDRERVILLREHGELGAGPEPAREHEWRYAAGAALGLALAVKWSAAWALLAGMGLAISWSLGLLRRKPAPPFAANEGMEGETTSKPSERRRRPAIKELGTAALGLGLIPMLVYLSSYSLYFIDRLGAECPFVVPTDADGFQFGREGGECVKGLKGTAFGFADLHNRMARYHLTLKATHGYQSEAYTWPIVKRPVAYYYPAGKAKSEHILAFGNPAVWWAAIPAALWLLARATRSWRPERVVIVGWGSQYLPWLIVSRPLFFFYMTPVVPFMMIGLAAALGRLRDLGHWARVLIVVYVLLAVGALLYFFYPVLTAVGLPNEWWRKRMWLQSWI